MFASTVAVAADTGDGDDDGVAAARTPAVDSRVEVVDGRVNLYLDEATQARIGLRVDTAQAHTVFSEIHGFGQVVDIRELVKLRGDYLGKRSELRALNIEIEARKTNVERLQSMHDDGAFVSFEQIYQATGDLRESRARASIVRQDMDAMQMRALQDWGGVLANVIGDAETPLLDTLVRREEYLVIAGFGLGKTPSLGSASIFVAADGDRAGAVAARLLAPAPHSSALQGETHYLLVAGENLRVGMRVDVWAPSSATRQSGATIPKSAVLWYGGHRWVYLWRGGDRFERQIIEKADALGSDLFVDNSVKPGDQIVVRGGETLLAEEFRWSIPDEDNE